MAGGAPGIPTAVRASVPLGSCSARCLQCNQNHLRRPHPGLLGRALMTVALQSPPSSHAGHHPHHHLVDTFQTPTLLGCQE